MEPISQNIQVDAPKMEKEPTGFDHFFNSFNPPMEDQGFRKQFMKNLLQFISQDMNRRMRKMKESIKKIRENH